MGTHATATPLLSACVTINVYFPAAEAKEAAREFVEKVIDEADKVEMKQGGNGGMAMLERRFDFDPWMLLGIGSAQAQGAPDITIKTPAIQAIQARMESRFNATLRAGFGSLRRFNAVFAEVYRRPPTQIRKARASAR